jgi:hypothetical protein
LFLLNRLSCYIYLDNFPSTFSEVTVLPQVCNVLRFHCASNPCNLVYSITYRKYLHILESLHIRFVSPHIILHLSNHPTFPR